MGRKVLSFAVGTGLAVLATAPAAAFSFTNGTTCTSGLEFCVNFVLQSSGGDAYTLAVTFTDSQALPTGVVATVGLYGPARSTGAVSGFSASSGATVWTDGTNNGEFVEADAPPPPSFTGLQEGQTVTVSFTSPSLTAFTGTLEARAHIISYGDNGAGGTCSLWVSTTSQNGIKDNGTLDPACVFDDGGGTNDSTVPEPVSMVLLGSGLLGIAGVGLRRRRHHD